MGLRRRAQTTRAYPAAGTSVTGSASRFRLSKTVGAREADQAAQAWEDQERDRERRGGTWLTRWTR
ncbi:hypothetical protein [Streptomyces scabiei]|uniref:hypothetical protein n=1 Tax=Streptomyces scabiei TaxID=1930 RepID=UPI001B343719|nr:MULTISPECIES: hypothetical protein [Streptomyces]MDX3125730.1 hypothetical protein [Streptomyces scabiei]MDX3202326.1 hypothetical protein [Streptomyces scabiei]MDX3223120.1 hypothetical protein [Streptomyces scabiei]MDX3298649.1 hypothetical protein [Streptomyces scabiei]